MSGPAGPTGPTGITGRRGIQGTPYGAPGTTFYSPSGRVDTVNIISTGGNIPNDAVNSGAIYYFSTFTTDPLINFPNLSSDYYGAFWTFTNTSGTSGQRICLQGAMTQLTIGGAVLTRSTGLTINIAMTIGETITFVFVGGSGFSCEYIAF